MNTIRRDMNTTLLIMAAGIGSRFGTGIKQLEPVDDTGHIIMDYLLSVRISRRNSKRSSVIVSQLFALLIM